MTMSIDLTPEHTARRQGDGKDLHPEVIAAYRYIESVLDSADVPSSKLRAPLWHGWALREAFLAGCSHAARTALSQPEPEGSARDLIRRLAHELYKYECLISLCPPDYIPAPSPLVAEAHAVIAADRARWGRPAVEPETNGQA